MESLALSAPLVYRTLKRAIHSSALNRTSGVSLLGRGKVSHSFYGFGAGREDEDEGRKEEGRTHLISSHQITSHHISPSQSTSIADILPAAPSPQTAR